jgi:hypothetical protein
MLEAYVKFYEEVIGENFSALKASFEPHTTEDIGVAGEFDIRTRALGWYGFRTLSSGEEKVLLLPEIASWQSNVLNLHGAMYTNRGAEPGLGSEMRNRVLQNEIGRGLEGVVRAGLLDESSTPHLLQEAVLAIVHGHPEIFSPSRRYNAPAPQLPISLDGLLRSVRYEKLYRHFMNERFDLKRKAGLVEEHWEGMTVSYDATPTQEDVQWADFRAREAMDQGPEPRFYGASDLDKVEKRLRCAVAALKQHDITSIAEDIFPFRSALLEASSRRFLVSIDEAWVHVQRLFELFYMNYALLVERNFPTIKGHFELYSRMPIILFVTVEKNRPGYEGRISVDFTACKAPPGATQNQIIRREERILGAPRGGVWHDGRLLQWLWSGGGGPLENFLRSGNPYLDFPVRGSYVALLREKVYRKIEGELKAVQEGLRDLYGLN